LNERTIKIPAQKAISTLKKFGGGGGRANWTPALAAGVFCRAKRWRGGGQCGNAGVILVRFYNQRGAAEQWIKEGMNRKKSLQICGAGRES
jgi:hypothetical protein